MLGFKRVHLPLEYWCRADPFSIDLSFRHPDLGRLQLRNASAPVCCSSDGRYLYVRWTETNAAQPKKRSKLVNLETGDEVVDMTIYGYSSGLFFTPTGLCTFDGDFKIVQSIGEPQFFDQLGRLISIERRLLLEDERLLIDGREPTEPVRFLTRRGEDPERPRAVPVSALVAEDLHAVSETAIERLWSVFGRCFLALADSYLRTLIHLPAAVTQPELQTTLRYAAEQRLSVLIFPNVQPFGEETSLDLFRPSFNRVYRRLLLDIDEAVPDAQLPSIRNALDRRCQFIRSASGNLQILVHLRDSEAGHDGPFISLCLTLIEKLLQLGLTHIDFLSMRPKIGVFIPKMGVFKKNGQAAVLLDD